MNKQEQIEKMARDMSVNESLCRQYDCDHCPYFPQFCWRKEDAERLIQAGYINGADFVEFVLNKVTQAWIEKRVLLGFKDLKSLLQEYLKGE